jgi:hypothetical protein
MEAVQTLYIISRDAPIEYRVVKECVGRADGERPSVIPIPKTGKGIVIVMCKTDSMGNWGRGLPLVLIG